MSNISELVARLRDTASKGISAWGDLQNEAADMLEQMEKGEPVESEDEQIGSCCYGGTGTRASCAGCGSWKAIKEQTS